MTVNDFLKQIVVEEDHKVSVNGQQYDFSKFNDRKKAEKHLYTLYTHDSGHYFGSENIAEYLIDTVRKYNSGNYWVVEKPIPDLCRLSKGFIVKKIIFSDFYIEQGVTPAKNIPAEEFSLSYKLSQDGWFWVLGHRFPDDLNDQLFRFYFNFDKQHQGSALIHGVVELIRNVITEFNERFISFKIKVPINLEDFSRADSVVLYIEKSQLWMVSQIISHLHDSVSAYLADKTPVFTYRIANGLGFAEEPVDETHFSFGQIRIDSIIENIKLGVGVSIKPFDANKPFLNQKSIYSKIRFNGLFPKSSNSHYDYSSLAYTDNHLLRSVKNIAFQLISSALIFQLNKTWKISWLNTSVDDEEMLYLANAPVSFNSGTLTIGWLLTRASYLFKDSILLNSIKLINSQVLLGGINFEKLYYFENYSWFLKEESSLIKPDYKLPSIDFAKVDSLYIFDVAKLHPKQTNKVITESLLTIQNIIKGKGISELHAQLLKIKCLEFGINNEKYDSVEDPSLDIDLAFLKKEMPMALLYLYDVICYHEPSAAKYRCSQLKAELVELLLNYSNNLKTVKTTDLAKEENVRKILYINYLVHGFSNANLISDLTYINIELKALVDRLSNDFFSKGLFPNFRDKNENSYVNIGLTKNGLGVMGYLFFFQLMKKNKLNLKHIELPLQCFVDLS